MADIKDFELAAKMSQTLKEKPSNEVLLQLYSLYKQASEGDVSGERPGGFDFKGMAKFDAWEGQKGKSKETAIDEYVNLVNSLLAKE